MPPITQIANVVVPVADQDHALAFYTQTLGFETRQDFTYDTGERWIEVATPGATKETALVLARSDDPGIETRVILITRDLDGARAELEAAGVPCSANLTPGEVVMWADAALGGYPPMLFFKDPDGNSFLLVTAPN